MSLGLGGVGQQQNVQSAQSVQVGTLSDAAKQAQTLQMVENLKPGQSLAGQIKSLDGNTVIVDLGNDVELSAKVESGTNLQVGQQVIFEVKSNQNLKLALSPLFTNSMANLSAAKNALAAANMPASAANLQMVNHMMQEGLSINRQSLWSMRSMTGQIGMQHTSAVVELAAMGVEITPENVQQLENYHNMQYQILDATDELQQGISGLIQNMAASGQETEAVQLMQTMLETLQGDAEALNGNGQIVNAEGQTVNAEGQTVNAEGKVVNAEGQSVATNGQAGEVVTQNQNSLIDGKVLDQGQGMTAEGELAGNGNLNGLGGGNESAGNTQTVAGNANGQGAQNTVALETGIETGTAVAQTREQSQNQIPTALQDLNALLQQNPEEVLKTLHREGLSFKDLASRFDTEFKGAVEKQFLLEAESFADKDTVKEYYQKLGNKVSQLLQNLTESGKGDTAPAQTLQGMQQNLNFMEAVNQVFPYLQIPLKASMENAHGDLYVYANQKRHATSDGSVSALLHLEMQNLGDLDVYVKLLQNNVSTHFYVEDESIIDFLEEHMDLLTERLEGKGYSVANKVSSREQLGTEEGTKSEDVINRIREREGTSDQVLVSMNAFDVRA